MLLDGSHRNQKQNSDDRCVGQALRFSDTELRRHRQAFIFLANIARHSADLAETVVETQIFPKMLTSLKFPDESVKKMTATLIKDICKHTPELAQLVVSQGSVAALVDHIADSEGNSEGSRVLMNPSRCLQAISVYLVSWPSVSSPPLARPSRRPSLPRKRCCRWSMSYETKTKMS